MTTTPSPDQILRDLEALRPDADQLKRAWDETGREQALQAVLTRTAAQPRPSRRRVRRILLGGLAAAVCGGGVAWAAFSNFTAWYTGGALDALTCVTIWHVPDGTQREDQYGGSQLTDDPIADCDTYAELTGKPRIVDPVATTYQNSLVVGPRQGMPADAVPITDLPKVRELERSLEDYVDGGLSRCFDTASGEQFVRAELARLGLTGLKIVTAEGDPPHGSCALLFVGAENEVHVRGHFTDDPDTDRELVNTLRKEVASQCLSLSEAKAAVDQALSTAGQHEPTSVRLDPEARCTRIDLVMGGSLQVFLYGPETAHR